MLARGLTSEYINKGMITWILKSGDHSKLGNWRPITLLGNIYKILVKTLAKRIQEFLPLVIKPNQTGFVEGRSILDNNFLAEEVLVWVAKSGQDLVLLLFDFEKTFDRIQWGFLFPTLSKLGFCPTWIKWISSLYWLASSSVKVNGELKEDFQLVKLVRQGCPLAPYLFILATDVLGHMLDDPKHEIEGLHLPKGGCVWNQTFADDTALYFKGSPNNLSKARAVLDLFCLASRAKINWGKTTAIWTSKEKKEWEWGQEIGLKWILEGQGVRYLGIQIGFQVPTKANFEKLMFTLKGKMIAWGKCNLSQP
jgi:hypothetical protein